MTIAIRVGIGARLRELGFEQRSSRVYVKETGTYSEWVHFRRHSEGDVADTYGIFDNALQAFCDAAFKDPRPTGMPGEPHDAHVCYESRDHARAILHDAIQTWRQARRPWRPLEYLTAYPEEAHPLRRFVSKHGRWRAGGDPEGCAEAMRASWSAFVEPERDALIADDKAVARSLAEDQTGSPDFQIATLAYLGETVEAQALVARYVDRTDFDPDPKLIATRRRKYGWSRDEAAAHAAAMTANSRKFSAEVDALARRLGLVPDIAGKGVAQEECLIVTGQATRQRTSAE